MKNLKKLVIASFMLVIAFVAVVSSTYAWFTQGTEAKVSDITIGVVDANKAMLISKDGTAWGKEVSLSYVGKLTPSTIVDFNAGEFAFKNLTLAENAPLSDINALEEHEGTLAKPTAPSTAEITDPEVTGYEASHEEWEAYRADLEEYNKKSLGGYIAIELYFQVTVNDAEEWENTAINMDLDNLHAYQVNDNDVSNVENQRALSSYRLAVVQHGNDSYTENYSKFIEDQSTATVSNVEIGGGRYGTGDQFLTSNNWMQVYATAGLVEAGATASDPYELADDYDFRAVNGKDFYKTANTQALDTAVDGAHEFSIECNESNIYYDELDGGLTRQFHITIYVWMEGWDGDNINTASGVQYKFDLNFKTE